VRVLLAGLGWGGVNLCTEHWGSCEYLHVRGSQVWWWTCGCGLQQGQQYSCGCLLAELVDY
jgi:hypothetical protein